MNKPVAWGMKDKDGNIYDCISPEEHDRHEGSYTTPLYTHPVKELTDEEIQAIAKESYVWNTGKQEWSEIEFARAILRKAQEK